MFTDRLVVIGIFVLALAFMAQGNEDISSAQWAIELKPDSNPTDIAEKHGFIYEGKHETLPNIHLFRLAPQHRTRDISDKVKNVQNDVDVVWSEVQIPRDRSRRDY